MMSIYFDTHNQLRSYDRNYVQDIYTHKQISENHNIKWGNENTIIEEDSLTLSIPMPSSLTYYQDFAADYIEGNISQEEFYSHIEDLYMAKTGGDDSMPLEKRQGIFDSIIQNVHNGIKCYYQQKNSVEGIEVNGGRPMFYYNAEYHYLHEEIRSDFSQHATELADKLNLSDKTALYIAEDPMRSVFTTLFASVSNSLGGAAKLKDFDIIPPRDMRISWSAYKEPFEVTFWGGEQKYTASIPFSYDTQAYKFELSDLFSGAEIPEKYMTVIKNISVINRQMAQACPEAYKDNLFCWDPIIQKAVNGYEKSFYCY